MNSVENVAGKNQEEALRQEMRQDAERKTQRIIQRAERDAAKMLEAVRDEMAALKAERLAAARHTAEERVRAIRAGIEQERRRSLLLDREMVIGRVIGEATKQVASPPAGQPREALARLLREAVGELACQEAEIRCAPRDVALVEELAESAKLAATVVADAAVAGGLMVECEGGRRVFDNTYAGRLARKMHDVRAVAYSRLKDGADGGAAEASA